MSVTYAKRGKRAAINPRRCSAETARPCNRKPTWIISYLGAFCSTHFELYFTSHTVDPKDVTRLSSDEDDFVTRPRRRRREREADKVVDTAVDTAIDITANANTSPPADI